MKQKIVMKVAMPCQDCRSKAMEIAAVFEGVISVAIEGKELDQLVVTGNDVDSACLIKRLRKKVGYADLVTIAEVKPKSPEKKPKSPEKPKPPPPCPVPKCCSGCSPPCPPCPGPTCCSGCPPPCPGPKCCSGCPPPCPGPKCSPPPCPGPIICPPPFPVSCNKCPPKCQKTCGRQPPVKICESGPNCSIM